MKYTGTATIESGYCNGWGWRHTYRDGDEFSHILTLLSPDGGEVKYTYTKAMELAEDMPKTIKQVERNYGKYD